MRTHITLLLDRSGSMSGIKEQTITGFNEFIKEQQKLPDYASVLFAQFDTEDPFEIREDFTNLQDVTLLNWDNFNPKGSTPLLDAIGKGIAYTKDNLKKHSQNKKTEIDDFSDGLPELVIFVIITDGQENASTEFKRETIKKTIEDHEKHGWKFVFLGANMDAVQEASSIGISFGQAATYTTTGACGYTGACGSQGAQGIMGATYALNNIASNFRNGNTNYTFTVDDREKMEKGY